MRFICGKTTCAGCDTPLEIIDDVIAVTPHEAAGTPWCGFFHRDCFDRLPDAPALTLGWRAKVEHLVRSRPRTIPILAESLRFLVVHHAIEEVMGVYYLGWWAEQRFEGEEQWGEFADLLTGDELPEALAAAPEGEIESSSGACAVRWAEGHGRLWLRWSEGVERQIEYPGPAFDAYTAANGPLAGYVDFAALAAGGELVPSDAHGELARCQGVVVRVDSTRDGYEVVYTARQPIAIELGRGGLAELQRVLGDLIT